MLGGGEITLAYLVLRLAVPNTRLTPSPTLCYSPVHNQTSHKAMTRKSTRQSEIQRGGGRCKAAISADGEWAGELDAESRKKRSLLVGHHGDATVTRAQGIVSVRHGPYLLSETGRD